MKGKSTSKGEKFKRLARFAVRAAQSGLLMAALLVTLTPRNAGAVPQQALRSFATSVAITPTCAATVTAPDPACFDRCQANLASCMASSNGDPVSEYSCQTSYNNCGEICLFTT